MKYRFFTLKQAENALRLAEKNVAPRIDEVFRPTRLEQMIFEDAGGDTENKALTELFHLLYASEHRLTEADSRFFDGELPCGSGEYAAKSAGIR